MDKSNKLYSKAIDAYNKGHIDNALNICEKSIGYNIKNSAAINLKGLLYYIKGDLITAQKLWKMNYSLNKNSISQKYLNDSKNDEEKFKMYIKAVKLIKNYEIDEALKLLHKCSKSDYNSINVNNHIAFCYIELQKYDDAIEYINKVLNIDKKNSMALDNYKKLRSCGIKINKSKKVYLTLVLSLISFAIIIFAYKNIQFKKVSKTYNNKNKLVSIDNKTKNVKKKITYKEAFPYNDMKEYIKNKNYDKIFEVTNKWKDKKLSVNDKYLLSESEKILTNEGVEYFYNIAIEDMDKKEFKKSINYLLKAYKYGKNNYLYGHILYMLGSCYQNTENVQESLIYYEEYTKLFNKGDYADTVLYNLSLIYSDIDLNKSKKYAEELVDNYPESMYNNSNIQKIINK